MSSPFFETLRREIRAVVGMLALFGVDDILLDGGEEVWQPENADEEAAISVRSLKMSRKPTSPSTWPVIGFDLIARSLLVADRATGFEAALNFFRKGRLDVKAEQFIDAVLDFLFMIETTYANGKIKTVHVEAEYLASDELRGLITQALSNESLRSNIRRNARMEQSYRQSYEGKTAEEVMRYLVKLRGELHHHTARRSGVWNPTDHIRFGADAFFLQHLCLGIAFVIARPEVFSAETVAKYEEQLRVSAAQGVVRLHRQKGA